MAKFTILTDTNSDIINALKNSKTVDISLIPKSPMLYFYNNNDELIYKSNNENDYAAIRLMIDNNNLKGYYFTVETEWWDDNDEYQGTTGEKHYQKFYFNYGERHCLKDFPSGLFQLPFECLMAIPH